MIISSSIDSCSGRLGMSLESFLQELIALDLRADLLF